MLTTLLESRSRRAPDRRGTIASVAVHAAIIFSAVYATATGAPARDKPANPPVIHWVPTPPPRSATSTPVRNRAPRTSAALPMARPLAVPIEIPTSLPSIDVQLPSVTTTDFPRGTTGNPDAPGRLPAGGSTGGGRRAYDDSEVETVVTVIGNAVPEYPSPLRASGIEGKVVAEFVVNELGRADAGSLRIISTTNDAFVESIRRALPRMRFHAARIGNRTVAQVVRQAFVFQLDR